MRIFTHLTDIVGTMKINLGTMSFRFTSLEMMTEIPKKKCIYGGRNIYSKRKMTHTNILALLLFIAYNKKERQNKKF